MIRYLVNITKYLIIYWLKFTIDYIFLQILTFYTFSFPGRMGFHTFLHNIHRGVSPTAEYAETMSGWTFLTVYSLYLQICHLWTRVLVYLRRIIRPHHILFSSGLYYLQIQKQEQKPQVIKQIRCSRGHLMWLHLNSAWSFWSSLIIRNRPSSAIL